MLFDPTIPLLEFYLGGIPLKKEFYDIGQKKEIWGQKNNKFQILVLSFAH